jgi:hypothetical protein
MAQKWAPEASFMRSMLLAVLVLAGCRVVAPSAETRRGPDERAALGALIEIADGRLQAAAGGLAVAARSEEARAASWERVKPLLEVVQTYFGPSTAWFAAPDGRFSTVEKGPAGSIADRPYFPKVMAGETSIGRLVVSRSTGEQVAIVAVPVKDGARVVGAVGASVRLDWLNATVKHSLELPDGCAFFALDADGVTALHTDGHRIFSEPLNLGGSVAAKIREMLANEEGTATYEFEGMRCRTVYRRSGLSGWTYGIRVPAE